jgi:hypothetical protein
LPDESGGQNLWRLGDYLGDRLQVFWIPSACEKLIHCRLIVIELKDTKSVRILDVITEIQMPWMGARGLT